MKKTIIATMLLVSSLVFYGFTNSTHTNVAELKSSSSIVSNFNEISQNVYQSLEQFCYGWILSCNIVVNRCYDHELSDSERLTVYDGLELLLCE